MGLEHFYDGASAFRSHIDLLKGSLPERVIEDSILTVWVGIVQMASCDDKDKNMRKAATMISALIDSGAELILLPELFNYLPQRIDRERYLENAEGLDGPTIFKLSQIAKNRNVSIIAGSIIERCGGEVFNTCCLVTPAGLGGYYRKVHLFKFGSINEGQVFHPGSGSKVVECSGMKFGLTICFDLRFPELYRQEALAGADAITNVAAFLEETGRTHWMPLLRARAIENQLYIVAANQAKSELGEPKYYGHSCIIDPWGRLVARAGLGEENIVGKIRKERVGEIRRRLPALSLMGPP